jgi:hypothetical protein
MIMDHDITPVCVTSTLSSAERDAATKRTATAYDLVRDRITVRRNPRRSGERSVSFTTGL